MIRECCKWQSANGNLQWTWIKWSLGSSGLHRDSADITHSVKSCAYFPEQLRLLPWTFYVPQRRSVKLEHKIWLLVVYIRLLCVPRENLASQEEILSKTGQNLHALGGYDKKTKCPSMMIVPQLSIIDRVEWIQIPETEINHTQTGNIQWICGVCYY